jgi:hypothetical protein
MKITILIAAVAAIVALAAFVNAKPRGKVVGKYKGRDLMTANEMEFFGRLVKALPDHYIFPQVSMGALLEAASRDKKQAHGDRLRIAQQRIDYLVCDGRCAIVAVIELDDKTHSRSKDQLRDARLEQAGIRVVRFQSRNKPSVEDIRHLILPKAPAGEGVSGNGDVVFHLDVPSIVASKAAAEAQAR